MVYNNLIKIGRSLPMKKSSSDLKTRGWAIADERRMYLITDKWTKSGQVQPVIFPIHHQQHFFCHWWHRKRVTDLER